MMTLLRSFGRRVRTQSAIVSFAAFMLISACGEAGLGSDAGVSVRDSAGIVIVENAAYAWGDGEGWRLAELPEVDIGVVEGEPVFQMFRVTGAIRMANGDIAVANSGTNEIRIYDPTGRFVAASGGQGEGPGEYRQMREFWPYRGDSLIAWDYGLRRATVMGPRGSFGRVAHMEIAPANSRILHPFADGSLILTAAHYDFSGRGIKQQEMELTLHGPEGTLRDSLGVIPVSTTILVGPDGAPPYVGRPGFSPRTTLAVADSEFYVGNASSPEVEVWAPDGELIRRIRWADGDRVVEQRHIDLHKAAVLEGVDDEDWRRRLEGYYREIPYERMFPAYERIVSDRAGRVWVELFRRPGQDGPALWMVIDEKGRTLGEISLPVRFNPFDIGDDYVLGVGYDEIDVEHVRLYRIHK